MQIKLMITVYYLNGCDFEGRRTWGHLHVMIRQISVKVFHDAPKEISKNTCNSSKSVKHCPGIQVRNYSRIR
jgi:hypothetical protein